MAVIVRLLYQRNILLKQIVPQAQRVCSPENAINVQHVRCSSLLNAKDVKYMPKRNVNFLNTKTGEQLWKSVTSVSTVGRQKGRGKGKRMRDLNIKQVLGRGKINYQWPGLTSPVVDRDKSLEIKELPYDQAYWDNIIEERKKSKVAFRRLKLKPLDRGFSGVKWPGRKLGQPEPLGAHSFDGFETICLTHKNILTMTSSFGKKKSVATLVVTGNGNGTIGFGKGQGPDGRTALRIAKRNASKRLFTLERCENRTIYHNIYSEFLATKVFLKKSPEGTGLRCHRVIRVICQLLGIKDLYAKVEGSTRNTHAICRAFVAGLQNQRSHQEIANETGLYIVEQHPDRDNYPVIVGVPTNPCTALSKNEKMQKQMVEQLLNAGDYFGDGKVYLRDKKTPWYFDSEPYQKRAWRLHIRRNKPDYIIKFWASEHKWDKKFRRHVKYFTK